MKRYTLLKIFVAFCFFNSMNAQNKAAASASATIVTPIQIIKNSDIDFGSFTTNGANGTLVLGADSKAVRVGSSNIGLPNDSAKTASAAGFTITGQGDFAYNLILPTSDYLIYNGAESMIINGFTSSASKVLEDGKEVIYLGATLHVGDGQSVGAYSSLGSGIEIVVNYN